MEVILLEKSRFGGIGDTVQVKDGFARNHLLPKGKALRATAANKQEFEKRRHEIELENQKLLEAAQKLASKLCDLNITIYGEASDDMKLYGSITQRDIAHAIYDVSSVEVDHNTIMIPTRIKEVRTYDDITIRLHHDVIAPIILHVVRNEGKGI